MKLPTADFRFPIVLMVILCASCSREEPVVEPEGVVARIGERVITAADLRREAQGQPGMDKEELLQALLEHEALLLRARSGGVADDPTLRREIDRLMVTRLRERELAEKLKAAEVAEEDARAEYERCIADYTRPAMDRLAMLFLRIEKNASEAKRKQVRARMVEARNLASQLNQDDGFGKLAINYSDDQIGRYRGGDIGWIARNKTSTRLPASVLKTGQTLDKGTLSEILATDGGLYIVIKTDTRPSTATAYEQVRGSLHKRLLADRRKMIETEFIETCMQLASPKIDEAALAKIELENAPQQPESPSLKDGLPVAGN